MEFGHVSNRYLYPDRYIKMIPHFSNKGAKGQNGAKFHHILEIFTKISAWHIYVKDNEILSWRPQTDGKIYCTILKRAVKIKRSQDNECSLDKLIFEYEIKNRIFSNFFFCKSSTLKYTFINYSNMNYWQSWHPYIILCCHFQVRIDPAHPIYVVSCDWVWGDQKTEAPCHSRYGTIKLPRCLKALSAKHRPYLAALHR
jgi:hypothetical protein